MQCRALPSQGNFGIADSCVRSGYTSLKYCTYKNEGWLYWTILYVQSISAIKKASRFASPCVRLYFNPFDPLLIYNGKGVSFNAVVLCVCVTLC